jgi:hypothetical protein
MTPERFQTIVDAYGADPRRWPQGERADAQAWAALHPGEAAALLAESASLDAWLASDALEAPPRVLAERIIATAPAHRRWLPRRQLWWSGAAFAGIGLAGGVAGALAVSLFVLTGTPPQIEHDPSNLTTSFSGSAADWSGE